MPSIWHLLKIFSFCFGKVTSKVGNPKDCDVLIFAYSWASESWLELKFNLYYAQLAILKSNLVSTKNLLHFTLLHNITQSRAE